MLNEFHKMVNYQNNHYLFDMDDIYLIISHKLELNHYIHYFLDMKHIRQYYNLLMRK